MLNKLKNIFSSGGAKLSASPTTQKISFSTKATVVHHQCRVRMCHTVGKDAGPH
jgi:hypothetical protein